MQTIEYRPLALHVSVIYGGYDRDNHLVDEQILPVERFLYPFGANVDAFVAGAGQEKLQQQVAAPGKGTL